MLKYLIICLSDSSASFCHYPITTKTDKLLPLPELRQAVTWAMKEDLSVQFVYPQFQIPDEYKEVISSIDHTDYIPADCEDILLKKNANVIIFDSFDKVDKFPIENEQTYILRVAINELSNNIKEVKALLSVVDRLNIVLTDLSNVNKEDLEVYKDVLGNLRRIIEEEYIKEHLVQINILTDRLMLDGMNNCNAGWESITLAPDGNLYICPAFYYQGEEPIGNIANGISLLNPQLYRLDHAPICRSCDAWQCHRCVWLNKKYTREINTPGREQCVIAHLERQATCEMLDSIRKHGGFMPEVEIDKLDYIDPFDKIISQNKKK